MKTTSILSLRRSKHRRCQHYVQKGTSLQLAGISLATILLVAASLMAQNREAT
jgi:hypothetical protein